MKREFKFVFIFFISAFKTLQTLNQNPDPGYLFSFSHRRFNSLDEFNSCTQSTCAESLLILQFRNIYLSFP